ncbi:thioredoxin-like protein AAED1, chloroplastic [Phalaenopsis equestris]|uniref:thioredoxin-like protein AAED1, chloroplastic n=1 Tax=Phalaenopsis equestris TaxID=78828 RepID=UPI0009E3F4A5|nr:thioredoxin-like protein AAED1, chloroplastic [Phalaenopsis equestris]
MAINLAISAPCLPPRPSLIYRSASAPPSNPSYPSLVVFSYHTKKSYCFSRFLLPIPYAAGSSGTASITGDKDISNSLEKVEVYDLTGKAVPIIDLWRDRKAIIAFARHFGCVLCRKRADVLASKKVCDLLSICSITRIFNASSN